MPTLSEPMSCSPRIESKRASATKWTRSGTFGAGRSGLSGIAFGVYTESVGLITLEFGQRISDGHTTRWRWQAKGLDRRGHPDTRACASADAETSRQPHVEHQLPMPLLSRPNAARRKSTSTCAAA